MESYHSCSASAHVPLYTKLVDPFTPEQTMWEFENLLVRTGEAEGRWLDISLVLKDRISSEPTAELAAEMLSTAKDLYAECERIQAELTKSAKN
jgi:hypothetical protein